MTRALKNLIEFRDQILSILKGKIDGFILAGGTALSLYYYRHRESFDLDFFTKEFSEHKITGIVSGLSKDVGFKINMTKKLNVKEEARIVVAMVPAPQNRALKIDDNLKFLKVDFIEDLYRDIESSNPVINEITVMSQENIYLRKIYAAFGAVRGDDAAGRERFLGGRQEAKDIFDLYYLSQTFMPLSNFMAKYCAMDEKVSAITWHRRYDRISLKTELLDIVTNKKIDYRLIEKHFDKEIEHIIKDVTG